ncbi:phosphatase PAP2 family protein [Patescibacteria group bacterium]|jgi:undecaprenyl-diphosphatase|nr:phosphatase PAP2 family protein [Patescibacteria group bacterium]
MTGELEIIHGMQSLLANDALRTAAVFASRWLVFLFIPVIAGLGYVRKKQVPLKLSLYDAGWSALAALIVANTLGQLIGRLRPYEVSMEIVRLIPPPLTAHAFPSGHTSVAFACAAALTYGRPGWGLVALVAAAAVGLGRVFVGVHYPSDVIAGAILGILCASIVRLIRTSNVNRKSAKS